MGPHFKGTLLHAQMQNNNISNHHLKSIKRDNEDKGREYCVDQMVISVSGWRDGQLLSSVY